MLNFPHYYVNHRMQYSDTASLEKFPVLALQVNNKAKILPVSSRDPTCLT